MATYKQSNIEKPKYEVITAEDDIEIRQYQPMIIAEVEVEGDRSQSASAGFRLVADFIFGNNKVDQSGSQKIAMTAPVQQQESQKIAMTAPVQQQESQKIAMTAPVQQQALDKSWLVSFVMPSEYTMESLPKPNNDRVTIKEVAGQKFAAIIFAGSSSKENLDEHEKQLRDYIERNKLESISGPPKYAFYNPPWVLPFMRRNEVMIELVTESQ